MIVRWSCQAFLYEGLRLDHIRILGREFNISYEQRLRFVDEGFAVEDDGGVDRDSCPPVPGKGPNFHFEHMKSCQDLMGKS